MKKDWLWMPHAGHFICGNQCEFKLNTYVNGYIVSTVGDLPRRQEVIELHKKFGREDADSLYEDICLGYKYETMVFPAISRKNTENLCCPYQSVYRDGELDLETYNSSKDAVEGHMAMCEKYDKKDK